jgi:hypothetical protein
MMRNLKNWTLFFESAKLKLTESDKNEVGYEILLAARKIWGYLNVDVVKKYNISINGQLLRMSKNNRILINYIKNISLSKSVSELKKWIEENSVDIFHPQGKYFNQVFEILENSYQKGMSMETLAKGSIIKWIENWKKTTVNIFSPSAEKDMQGYDLFFKLDDKIKSAQVKTLVSCSKGKFKYFVRCKGHLQDLKTNYLVAVNENECYIFNTYGFTKTEEYYSFNLSNLLYYEKFTKN